MLIKTNEPGEKRPSLRLKWPRQEIRSREILFRDKDGKARVFSVTSLNNEWVLDEEMLAIDASISRGESLHDVFTRNGYSVRKNVLDVYVISLNHLLTKRFETNHFFAKTQNAEYIVRKGETVYCYAIVRQIYSPEFWSPEINEKDKQRINYSFYSLLASGFSRNEIWELMDEAPLNWWKTQQQ